MHKEGSAGRMRDTRNTGLEHERQIAVKGRERLLPNLQITGGLDLQTLLLTAKFCVDRGLSIHLQK